MAKFSIYSKDGSVIRHLGEPTYNGTFMGVSTLVFSNVESPAPINWQRGDYVDYHRTGMRYRLYSFPEPKKQARKGEYEAAFVYPKVTFCAATKDLEIAPFRDLVPEDNDIHFSTRPDVNTYENVYGIAARIQECMNDIFPGKWEINVFDTSDADLLALFQETKEFSVSNGTCLDALSQIYEVWKNVGWIHTYDSANDKEIITIGRTSIRDTENTSDTYAYGIKKGLASLKKSVANEGEFATRLYVYGSERNIQTRYYNGLNIHDKDSVNIVNLMLPLDTWGKTDGLPDARKAYLQADDSLIEKYGLIPRTVYFDGSGNEEIYPSIEGLTEGEVRSVMIAAGVDENNEYIPRDSEQRIDKVYSATGYGDGSKEEVEENPTFTMIVRKCGFNVAEQGKLSSEGKATIAMKDGLCAGREFKVKTCEVYASDYLRLGVERLWDESLGMGFPNDIYSIGRKTESFVYLDIPMPNYYITLAQNRLLDAGQKRLNDYSRESIYYEPSVDPIKIKDGGKLLREGMYMQVYDKDIVDTKDHYDYVLIDSLTIDEKGALPSYKVTLRDQKRSSRSFGTLEEMIEDAKSSASDEIKRSRLYTDRRFRSAQETLDMLKAAFTNFSESIRPVTVETMSLLVGDESLQFKFTSSLDSLSDVACPLSYDNSTKQFVAVPASLIHMTLGIDAVTTKGALAASNYMGWDMPEWYSPQFDEEDKKYYIYAKVPTTKGGTGEYIYSETPIGMQDVEGYYHLMIGILNSEYTGSRDFVTLYGFTEILPGQITTDIIRDANSNLIIDLLNATITAKNGAKIIGDVEFGSNSSGLSNLSEWQGMESRVQKTEGQLSDVNTSLGNIQNQIDGVVENYFMEGVPTLENAPYTDWTTDNEKLNHVGDTYTNINEYKDEDGNVVDEDAGKSWRWCECGTITLSDQLGGITTSTSWYKFGTIDKTKNHTVVKLLAYNGQQLSITNLVKGKNTVIYSARNVSLRVESSGEVYIYDPQGYFSSSRCNLYFYADVAYAGGKLLHWHPIADSDAVKALQEAAKAQTTADGKARTFVDTPYPPYDVGDLWIQGGNGDLMKCKVAKDTSGSFSSDDWELATKYTDDTVANNAQTAANNAKELAQTMEYLKTTFPGSTIVSGGVIAASTLFVRDANNVVKGMFNGGSYASDSTNGRLILAAGSAGSTAANMKAATTRIYEDGTVVSKSADIEGIISASKGNFGTTYFSDGFINKPSSGLQTVVTDSVLGAIQGTFSSDSQSAKYVNFAIGSSEGSSAFSVEDKDGDVVTSNAVGHLPGLYVKVRGSYTTTEPVVAAITADGTNYAFRAKHGGIYVDNGNVQVNSGMFAGLRPYAVSKSSAYTATDTDHTIVMSSGTLTLPSSPKAGQVYKVIHTSTSSLTIKSASTNIKIMNSSIGTAVSSLARTRVEIINLHYVGGYWYVTLETFS